MITDWKNKKVAVLGLGVEGLSSLEFLHKKEEFKDTALMKFFQNL